MIFEVLFYEATECCVSKVYTEMSSYALIDEIERS